MAGHSHWAGIKHKKGRVDKERSRIFSKLSREITVSAKLGDKDPDMNPRLRTAIQAAKQANMPKDNISRAISKSEMDDNKNYENAISIIDSLFEKLGEISGTEEFANKLDDLISVIDNDEVDEQKLIEVSSETFGLFNLEVSWRDDANKNLMPELIKYNDVIKHNIGLRLQNRLTKEQAKFVARCNSVHRDISLNF